MYFNILKEVYILLTTFVNLHHCNMLLIRLQSKIPSKIQVSPESSSHDKLPMNDTRKQTG